MRHQPTSSPDLVSNTGIPSASVFLNLFTIRGNYELLELLSSKDTTGEGLNLHVIAGRCRMTRNKCLKRLTELQEIGVVFKVENRYYSSSLGSQIFTQLKILRDTIQIHSNLKAVDAIQSDNPLNDKGMSVLSQALISNNIERYYEANTVQSPVLSKSRKPDFRKF
jgi:hypothetical protein